MKKQMQYGILFFIGAIGYSTLEIAFRGYTHWTMVLTGGLCFCFLYMINEHFQKIALWKRCLLGAAVITGVEFIVGCIVNLWFRWNVWDYSALPLHLFGQICILFSILWFFLCIPIFFITRKIKNNIH
ncbi:putative ABC transporter permease [Anaerovorax sp. IOR16]|uniref:putative ABC transporter permease n=1 Tax=Anaerovorax sp. IOR16 TaxID=2773458 RepID=UPI0019D0C7B6|nr:hypothetical protein [Anaerovorax sp. IOR16]